MPGRRGFVRLLLAGGMLAAQLLVLALPVAAQQTEITSPGPLTRVIISDELNCQVAHRDDRSFELFPGSSEIGSCGTFLAVGGTLYGPGTVTAGISPDTTWAPVSQGPVSGAGTTDDPFRIVTVVDAVGANLRIEQTDSYATGSQSYRTDISVTNNGIETQTGVLYRAGDCYLQESDRGFGRVDGGAPACIVDPAEGRRIEQWLPITPGSTFMEGYYGSVWLAVASQQPFPNTCQCNEEVDNGAGLSWPVSVGAGQSVVISHETFFSPVGRDPVVESFTEAVPAPTNISLDPIVIAQSLAITAAVILLVPFPSALFNNTLEENYDEVMAGLAKVKARLAALFASITGWTRRQVDQRRHARAKPPPTDSSGSAPEIEPEPIAAPPATLPPEGTSPAARDVWRTPQGMILFVLVSALVYAFLDPTFGFSLISLATLGGLGLGLAIVLAAYGLPLYVVARQRRLSLSARALPATLIVAVLCVIVSRVADFQPGYLYGLIVGFFFAGSVEQREEGRAEAIAAGTSLAVAAAAWISLIVVRGGGGTGDELATALVEAAAVTVVVAGLEGAIFAMLPLRFLPGATVYAWDRRIWIILLGLGVFGFAHVLLNPTAGYMADTTRSSFFTMVALLVLFALVSVLFWAWFRLRPRPAGAEQ